MTQELTGPGPEVPVIDESRLISEFGDDAEVLAELKDLFLQHVPPLYNSIQEAVQNADSTTLAQDAHSLKGACATFGAPRLALVCLELEKLGKAGDTESAQGYLAMLSDEYERVFASIGSVEAQP